MIELFEGKSNCLLEFGPTSPFQQVRLNRNSNYYVLIKSSHEMNYIEIFLKYIAMPFRSNISKIIQVLNL